MLSIATAVSLLISVEAGKSLSKQQYNKNSDTYVWLGIAAFLFGLFLIDRRNDHQYSRTLRGAIGDIVVRYKSRKRIRGQLREKIEAQEPSSTPKSHIVDHQRTYINAHPVHLESGKQEVVLPQQIQSDTPEADFKGVFEIKETKCKHKINKKSKSKLKGRLLGKGSDQEEPDPSGEGERSGLIDENSLEKSGGTQEDQTIEKIE